jgi:hypothetical protein
VDLDAGSFLLLAEGAASGSALTHHSTRLPSAAKVMLGTYAEDASAEPEASASGGAYYDGCGSTKGDDHYGLNVRILIVFISF